MYVAEAQAKNERIALYKGIEIADNSLNDI